jgi:hypothetical protein
MWDPAPPLPMSAPERTILEAIVGSQDIPGRIRKRAQIILRAADGAANCTISREAGISRPGVLRWRQRFTAQGIRGLWDQPGPPPPPGERVPEQVQQAILDDSLYHVRLNFVLPPWDWSSSLRWTVRNLGTRHRVSRSSVQRLWKKHGIRFVRFGRLPRIDLGTVKISQDPLFGVTVYQIAGLFYEFYGPALVFCSRERPFRELSLSSLSEDSRRKIGQELATRLQRLEDQQIRIGLALSPERGPMSPTLFGEFVRDIMIDPRHQGAEIHVITQKEGFQGIPEVRAWLTHHACIRLHDAPWSHRAPRWDDLAGRWLQAIADWPMQTSFVESAFQLSTRLREFPADAGPLTKVILL